MKIHKLTAVFFLFLQNLKSQDSGRVVKERDTILTAPLYLANVYQIKNHTVKGYLVTIKDSSLYLSQNKMPLSFNNVNTSYLEKLDYSAIWKVTAIKPHVMTRSVLIGMAVGIAAGALIGYSGGSDSGLLFALNAGAKAVAGALIGCGAGALVGTFVGKGSEKKFLIGGDWKSLEEMKESFQNSK